MPRSALLANGVPAGTIDGRLAAGRYLAVLPGVYALGHSALTPEAWMLAAVLSVGDGAALSHQSAATLWRIGAFVGERHHVSAPRSRRYSHRGVRVHRPLELPDSDVTIVDGVPVTSVSRTLVDLAGAMRPAALVRVVHEAQVAGVLDQEDLVATIDAAPGRRGVGRLRAFAAGDMAPTKNEFERRFREFLTRARLPPGETNQLLELDGRIVEADVVWHKQKVIVELDGYAVHGTRRNFETDRARDIDAAAAGYRTLRVTWRKLRDEPTSLVSSLRRVLAGDNSTK